MLDRAFSVVKAISAEVGTSAAPSAGKLTAATGGGGALAVDLGVDVRPLPFEALSEPPHAARTISPASATIAPTLRRRRAAVCPMFISPIPKPGANGALVPGFVRYPFVPSAGDLAG
ncbi:hypothetical protein Pme01_24290 [Planosporangium mesophilum]|uniref:Uncharacterized protein n=1 Tax=Planosporangium mesophilum TaxID=689768 RepID=A0A8J3TBH7_9ACTN|nr:hypothetical protein Pme01_24290 [Planosporangium mesophilum]